MGRRLGDVVEGGKGDWCGGRRGCSIVELSVALSERASERAGWLVNE